MGYLSMTDQHKRKRADRARAWREAEEARRKQDAKIYEAFCKRQEAGKKPGEVPLQTCCDCFDNCGERTHDFPNLREQLSINSRVLLEEFARLPPYGPEIMDPEWHLAPQEISNSQPSRLDRHLEPCQPVYTAMEKIEIGDLTPHQNCRKAKHPAHHPCEAVPQASFSLDLNTNMEDCITTAQKRLASFSFYNPEDHTIHFTPSIIGQTTQVAEGMEKKLYLVDYWPEDILPVQWLPEEEATKAVVKKCTDLGPLAW